MQGTRAIGNTRIKAAVVGLLTLAAGLVPLAGTASAATEPVIVQGSSAAAAAAAVERVGGHVDATLGLVGGVAARVDGTDAATLRAGGLSVTPDLELHATGKVKAPARPAAQPQVTATDPDADYPVDAGKDVGVAVVDTGVTEVAGLAGKVVYDAPDFSGENEPRRDGYGHGTFMAGLVVGDGIGLAPGAKVVSVKVGDSTGTTTLSKLVAGLGWVAENAEADNIRVLNLSFGVQTPFPYQANPLDSAVEALWATGITVVTAAGNEGAGVVTSPGDDPFVLTVGAVNATWSGSQTFKGYSKPEVVAPGTSVVSYRAPGSQIDADFTDGIVDDTYRRGSGTSMATALVSGAAAVLAQHHPGATPDDIKGALTSTSSNGIIDLNAADNATWSSSWWQTYPLAFGGSDLGIPGWTAGMPWTAGHWAADYWTAGHWAAGQWATNGKWVAGHWADGSWVAGHWAAGQWAAGHWADGAWDAGHWAAGQWAAGQWAAGHWAANAWTSGHWAAGHWAAGQWAAGHWAAGQWAAGQWAAGQWAAGQWAAGQWAAGQWAAGQWAAGQWADRAWT